MASTTDTNAPSGKYEKYLEDRIAETSQQVKWVELLSFFLFLTLFVLGTLFVLCLVDAWILELHVWMRWSALLLLASGSLLLAIFKAIPFLRHRINPLYAARKLEEGRPELKNSVINYLTTRAGNSRKSALAIYQKMSQRAATDVASIPQDVTVDRSRMIFAGYALAAVVAVFGLYKVLSPKDPFQTIGRVLVPSSEWMAPSRVSISELSPGNAQRYFGEQVEISARIRGLADSESGWVMITSDDGRRKDFGIRLIFDEESGLHRASLGGEKGLQESFSYRIEAGDAYTLTHRIDLRTCPTVFVESVEYQPPDYTGIPGQRVESPSGISNVEGTLVRVTVRANLAMETAYLELFRTVPGGNDDPARETENGDSETRPEKSKSVRLELGDDNTASGEFLLELNERRTGPRFTHYQAVFTSVDGDRSQNPTLSDLEVIPDLSPEVEVLLPEEKIVQIPSNQLEKISVSAVDPDYGLTSIRLVVENRGNRLLEESLFQSDDALGARGRQTGSFEFRPDRYGLKEGDEVIWFVRAEDNRAAGRSQVPDPNRKRTENYKFLITPPLDAGKQENAGEEKGDPANPNPERENQLFQKGVFSRTAFGLRSGHRARTSGPGRAITAANRGDPRDPAAV